MSETAKHRKLVEQYCQGNGMDLGSAGDPIVPHAIQCDLPLDKFRLYNRDRPDGVIHWRGTADLLPFYNETLDFVHSSHLLEDWHLQQWPVILHEWTRVLKPGGYLIVSVPDHERFRAAVRRGQGDNLGHRHESRQGEVAVFLPGWKILYDGFVNDDPNEYSLLTIAQKP